MEGVSGLRATRSNTSSWPFGLGSHSYSIPFQILLIPLIAFSALGICPRYRFCFASMHFLFQSMKSMALPACSKNSASWRSATCVSVVEAHGLGHHVCVYLGIVPVTLCPFRISVEGDGWMDEDLQGSLLSKGRPAPIMQS
ncbi:hypothetical protein K402DRAFT_241859 [Aulographum hederae CBS 113979]|uniref:Uncharacterized protein n=1 Tax=Aulographum hederae CBS 113979 TaxID=1176131 RepID=A0A6G1H9I0_9PEZI|nr:hypothetical protein K402DRAFT_241859 [Aulographum hederae CBS 113979]